MATIRKHRDKWQVQVRRAGQPAVSKSFLRRSDAERWARDQEVLADRGELRREPETPEGCFRDIIERYRDTVSPRKKGCAEEQLRLNAFLRHPLASKPLMALDAKAFATYRDERLAKVSSSTVRREFVLLHHVLQIARREWGIPLRSNPIDDISRPPHRPARTRRLKPGEMELLLKAMEDSRNPLLKPVVLFAIATGMRRGELLSLRWSDVDLEKRHAQLRHTKNGHPRVVPLSSVAISVLAGLRGEREGQVFPLSAEAVKRAWARVVRRAGIIDLRLHDLRHEAISCFFELGLSMPEVALISGHRDPRMLFRYTHLQPSEVAAKLG